MRRAAAIRAAIASWSSASVAVLPMVPARAMDNAVSVAIM